MSEKVSPYKVLRDRFPEGECVLISEVSDKAGFSRSRSLDFMVINLWESRGLAITGIELKSSRTDWLRELKDPKKQENHFKYCDYFYLMTDAPNIAFPDEIPITWGHLHINEKGVLKTIKQAPRLNPQPVDRSLLCAMLKRAQSKKDFVHIDSLQEKIQEAAERLIKQQDWETRNKLSEYEYLQKYVSEFEEASGIKIKNYHETYGWGLTTKDIGRAVKYFLKHDIDHYLKRMQTLKEQADGVAKAIGISLSKFHIKDATEGNSKASDADNEREEVSA